MALDQDAFGSVIPRMTIFSEEQKAALFAKVLELLEQTGVRVDHPQARELLDGAGARVGDDNRVRIPSSIIEDAVKATPPRIEVYNRLGEQVVILGDRRSYFASQVDSMYFFDPFDRTRRRCVRADARLGAVLCDGLPNIDLVSFSSLYGDVPAAIALQLGHKDTVTHCTKPLVHGTVDLGSLTAIAEMAAVVAGGWDELARKPYYIHYAEPVSPLVHSEEGVAKLLFCVEKGIPVVYTPMTVGGFSAPVTGAGNLVSCIAESLSGIVIAQLKRRGAPVIFGGVTTLLDMSSADGSYGAPRDELWSAALTEMAHFLRLPVFSTAGCTDAVCFDEQAAAESAISCLMAAMSGANLIHDVGFTEGANSASLELIAATDELIGFVRTITSGFQVTADTLALDIIDQVGPGGSYLGQKHTRDWFRSNWLPALMNRHAFGQWSTKGSLSLGDQANRRVKELLEQHEPVPLPGEVRAELDRMESVWTT